MDVAVELRQPLKALAFDRERCEHWFNREHHGLQPSAVAAALRGLLRGKLIALVAPGGQRLSLEQSDQAVRWLSQAEAPALSSSGVSYGLTTTGGAAWEAVARPDWTRYLWASYAVDPHDAVVICADAARARWLALGTNLAQRPIAETVRHDLVEPWSATYWKTLPRGHRVRFRYEEVELGESAAREALRVLRDARDWYQRG